MEERLASEHQAKLAKMGQQLLSYLSQSEYPDDMTTIRWHLETTAISLSLACSL